MKKWIEIFFNPGAPIAPVPLVFLSVAAVVAFQLPAHLLMSGGHMMWGIAANEVIAIMGVPLSIAWFLGFDKKKLFPFRWPGLKILAVLVVFTVAADFIMDYLTYGSELVFPPPDSFTEALKKLIAIDGASSLAIKLAVLCVLPGICEEIFFRGFCQTSIEAKLGRVPALLIAAFLFGLLHGNPWYFHLYFVLGLIMGWLYIISGTLIVPIAFHIMNNAWTVVGKAYGYEVPIEGRFGFYDAALILSAAAVLVFIARQLKLMLQRRKSLIKKS